MAGATPYAADVAAREHLSAATSVKRLRPRYTSRPPLTVRHTPLVDIGLRIAILVQAVRSGTDLNTCSVSRIHRNAQIHGDPLQRDVVFQSPVAERSRKAGADVAVETRLFGHGERLPEIRL